MAKALLAFAGLPAFLWTLSAVTASAQTFTCSEAKVPMRDGVLLAADVYLPKGNGSRFPVIVERTPYNKSNCHYPTADYFAQRGYVVVIEDERGRYNSGGEYYWWRDTAWGERQDGYDTVEWAAKQPWSTGKVGTMGLSMGCHNQYMTAVAAPPHLAAMFCADAAGNPYKDLFYQGGALHLIMPEWLLSFGEMARPFRLNFGQPRPGYAGTTDDWLAWYLGRERRGLTLERSMIAEMMRDMVAHQSYDDYWRQFAADEHLDRINVPIFHFGAWYDRYPLTQVRLFNGLREKGGPLARTGQKIQLGPWTHGSAGVMSRVVGDVDFGPDAAIDYNALRLRWFDYHLKGIGNGVMDEPPIRIFVMGANTWRDEREFPPARARNTAFYFHAGPAKSIASLNDGVLSTQPPGDEKPDAFVSDPSKPVPTVGGDLFIEPAGPRDHRPADRLSLTYTTAPLERDTEVTGLSRVEFDAASSAVDTDWVVAISAVRPDGYAQILRQNLLRARYRNGLDRPATLLTPGQIYHFTIEMFPISNLFKAGQRIRVTVASSSFPKWLPNGQTGRDIDHDMPAVIATNTIYHDREHPGFIALPIIPASPTRSQAASAGGSPRRESPSRNDRGFGMRDR